MKTKYPNAGKPIVIGKIGNGVFLVPEIEPNGLFWLFRAAHLLHADASDRKDKKALKLIKAFCKSVDAEYLK